MGGHTVYKWLLALAGWGLVSGCGSDDSTGSRRYEAEAVQQGNGEEDSSTPTDQRKSKNTPKTKKSTPKPAESTPPPETTESDLPVAPNRIEKDHNKPKPWDLTFKPIHVDWSMTDK
jgi:hypothetical protein